MTEQLKSIVDTAVAAGSFGTLINALKTASLDETLQGAGPFTVFAPNDAAFAKLPAGAVDSLLKTENRTKLTQMLKLHVVPSAMSAQDLTGKVITRASASGEDLQIDGTDGVRVNRAKVLSPDVKCSNGVIHVIDSVMMPKSSAKAQ